MYNISQRVYNECIKKISSYDKEYIGMEKILRKVISDITGKFNISQEEAYWIITNELI